ncbi:hypothetical protein B0H14DRAFT_2602599 [Mycena olivaceomarginata]|nr:hypothetical protein B0H14DRAFT_2602599 [Mycena olivaceomarginata]
MATIPPDKACVGDTPLPLQTSSNGFTFQFLALILETLLYGESFIYGRFGVNLKLWLAGVFLVLFVATWWCIYQRRPITTNRMQLVTMSLIWVLSTVHLIIDILRANQAFVAMDGGRAEEYYLNLANPLQAAKTAVYVTLTLVGDSFASEAMVQPLPSPERHADLKYF